MDKLLIFAGTAQVNSTSWSLLQMKYDNIEINDQIYQERSDVDRARLEQLSLNLPAAQSALPELGDLVVSYKIKAVLKEEFEDLLSGEDSLGRINALIIDIDSILDVIDVINS